MEISEELALIQLAIKYIQNDDISGLDRVFRAMPLEKVDDTETLLSVFLSICAGNERADAAKLVLERWKVIYPPEEKLSMLSRLYLINKINNPTLAFVTLIHKDFTYVELMDELIEFDNSPEIITACSKADQIFGKQNYATYEIVKDHAFEFGNYKIEEYMIANMEEVAPFVKKPDWVKNFMEQLMTENQLYQYTDEKSKLDVKFELPDLEESVELLTKGMSNMGISINEIEKAKDFLREKLSIATKEEKLTYLRPVFENLQQLALEKDTLLFRTFGPSNPLVNQDLTLNTPSAKYGGCRMFITDLFDYNEEFEYVEDWFQGVCNECHNRIKYRWYALRRPRPHGGWENCYCSFKCIRESLLTDGLEPALLTRELINLFEKDINTYGIQDRLPNPEIGDLNE